MTSTDTLEKIIQEYCTFNTDYDDLRTWIFRCLNKTIDGRISANVTDEYNHCNCKINYIPSGMIFSISKIKNIDWLMGLNEEIYEVGVWVSSYLMNNFGQTTLESLQKEVFFSDLDIYELSQEITYDINEWCNNIENVFDGLYG